MTMIKDESVAGDRMHVTVAICTWNRCALLRQTLASLTQVTTPPGLRWEVLVVNNNCTDDTDAVAAEFSGRLSLRIIHEPIPGTSHARSRALQECGGAYVVFADDDVIAGREWLEQFVNAAQTYPDAAVFGGPVVPWFPHPPDPRLAAEFPAIRNGFCGIDHRRPIGPIPANLRLTGANMGFRMASIRGLQFDPALGGNGTSLGGGEETAFIEAVRHRGGQVIWVPGMTVQHYVDPSRMTIEYLIRLARDRGRSTIRERGIPPGRRIAGAPARLWLGFAAASINAAAAFLMGRRIRAAGQFATAERFRAKIAECWAVGRHGARAARSD